MRQKCYVILTSMFAVYACEDLGNKMGTRGLSEGDPKEFICIKAKLLEQPEWPKQPVAMMGTAASQPAPSAGPDPDWPLHPNQGWANKPISHDPSLPLLAQPRFVHQASSQL